MRYILFLAATVAYGETLTGKVASVEAETKAIPPDKQLRVVVEQDACGFRAGDSVPMTVDRAHNANPRQRVTLTTECRTREGRLVVEIAEVSE